MYEEVTKLKLKFHIQLSKNTSGLKLFEYSFRRNSLELSHETDLSTRMKTFNNMRHVPNSLSKIALEGKACIGFTEKETIC